MTASDRKIAPHFLNFSETTEFIQKYHKTFFSEIKFPKKIMS